MVKQISVSCDLNMEGLGSQADISNQFDTGVRSSRTIKMMIIKLEMLLSVDQDLKMLSTRSMVKLMKRKVTREKENGEEADYKKIKCC